MIDVSELIHDPDFCQDFTVYRRVGQWVNGRFETETLPIVMTGIIIPQTTREIVPVPEGDTIRGSINIYTLEMLHTTKLADSSLSESRIADEIEWNCELYTIMQSQNYKDYGYFYSVGIRKLGA